jgi:pyruvate dehydrogenase E1 component
MQAMLENQEDVFYYLTVMNENYAHKSMLAGAEEGILRGMHRVRASALAGMGSPANGVTSSRNLTHKTGKSRRQIANGPSARVQLLGSGTILREVLAAAELLERDWNVSADVWSVTSFTELRRAGLEIERRNRLHPTEQPQLSWVEQCLDSKAGPVIAATDYVRAVPDLIRTWVSQPYVTLGTDGFGRSDTRAALRRFFEVDRTSIALAAIKALADSGLLSRPIVSEFMTRYGYAPAPRPPWGDPRDSRLD